MGSASWWQKRSTRSGRPVIRPGELTIVRPGIVYGKGEHGNMTRLYRGQKKGYFFYAGRKDTIKACIYVKELVRFFK